MGDRPIILSIAGVDPSGGAGIVADVKTIDALECFPAIAITSITFQNTSGVYGASHQSVEVLRAQIDPILNDFKIAAVKTGMLPTAEIITEVARIFSEGNLPAPVVDPVMRATSGDSLIEESALDTLKERLFPIARVVTPNIPEAERLTGSAIKSIDDMKRAAATIRGFGADAVLVKGGHMPLGDLKGSKSGEAVDVLLEETGSITEFRRPYFDVGNVHGSGCTLSAAIASYLGKGKTLVDAVYEAKGYVTERIRLAQKLGHGALPL
ncbi:MAG TPA: bifunctional hydroxymethylpyrimidine kinase/phosphomethylpyrimidine kinase [Pyrinomonadaceae bacterium]|nr:bifunctional hydroxymethylpyrimidine kinase/phosphomethylpyrimidine kinase [Pyrinomonadaceae bacterium]